MILFTTGVVDGELWYNISMKIILKYVGTFLFLLVFLSSVFTVKNVLATVGGPTFIYDFKYNPSNESVYYIKQDFGGRGCPPELIKISLNTEKTDIAFSCSEGEKLPPAENPYTSPASIEISRITKDFKALSPINLKDNNISININFVSEENYSPEVNDLLRRHFTAYVYQNGSKIDELKITGCNLDQPFLFQGYAIPGFEKKIALLLSTRGDCFEGGYIDENLYVVGGVNNLDKTPLTNFYKDLFGLTPNEGSLVVFESDKGSNEITKTPTQTQTQTPPPTQTEQQKFPTMTLVIVGALSLIIGTILGTTSSKIFSNKNKNVS